MEFMETIFKRRSVRKFTDKKVERSLIDEMLRAAMAGPTALGKNPWQFLVADTPESIEKLQKALPYGKYNCTAAVVVMGDIELSKHYWAVDGLIAATNLTNAAADKGIDSVWIGLYPFEDEWKEVQKIMSIPENVKPVCVIELGYGEEETEARTSYMEERIHWNEY
ncbi:nitroreductase family protein [Lactonifactor longoviformis]|uniref:Nitroreductase n=1 Tax=Lactonifactor longoviformis DSM 17459 TaxID=1122155 RepID=A0A1M4US37_9CLOT|nr:nitroreductase family protein [Lactonifactor longoviformis]POP31947.1 nitroreductase family protein [Lactonifactor longoviformis]SHE59420.1 Nitroreductase [Lactonifactor longoviformis DSM 17459]